MPFRIVKSKDKDGKAMYCAHKEGVDEPKACSNSKKNIRMYVSFATLKDKPEPDLPNAKKGSNE